MTLDRSPGLRGGLAPYQSLASHLNIILGANASGKSSTARAIQELIWKHGEGGIFATALAELDGQTWEISVEGQKTRTRRNGVDDQLMGIPAWEGHIRYMLALHELVRVEDNDLARQVVNDSQGYDLQAAEGSLKYHWGGLTRRNGLYQAYDSAKSNYNSLFNTQDDLNRQQQQLERLGREKEEAELATSLLEWNRQLIEFEETRQSLMEAEQLLAGLPDVIKNLTGNEDIELNGLRDQLIEVDNGIAKLQVTIDTAIARRTRLQLPTEGVPEGLLNLLEEKIAALADVERSFVQLEQELAGALASEQSALNLLGTQQNITDWDGVNWMNVETLDEHFRTVLSLLNRKGAVMELITELERSMGSENLPTQERLADGIRSLTAWLQERQPETKGSIPSWTIWVMTGLAILPALATWLFGTRGLVALLLEIVAAILIYIKYNREKPQSPNLRESDFRSTGLREPTEWTVIAIQERLNDLVDLLGLSRWRQQITGRLGAYKDELASMAEEQIVYDRQYGKLRSSLKLVPQAPVEEITSFSGMYWFLHHAANWNRIRQERVGLDNKLNTVTKQQTDQLKEINALFAGMEPGMATDSLSARMLRTRLAEKDTIWRQMGDTIENGKRNIADRLLEREQRENRLQVFYTKLAVATGDDNAIRELAGKVEDFRSYCLRRDQCRTLTSERERLLKENPLYTSRYMEMDHIDVSAIEGRMPAWRTQAENLESLKEQIANIRLMIRHAESGSTIETALKQKEDCVGKLELEYDNHLHAMTGKLLVEALKKQADERDRPPVFKAAGSLFSLITQGRYQLRLNSDEPPTFAAFDTVDQQWRNLDELSTGTRIQLLLSVRLAFIDSLEPSVRVPIIADELLANSDRHRAEAIMSALVEISREGRQVFYFTSQEAELVKWKDFLQDKPEISQKIFLLNGQESNTYLLSQERRPRLFLPDYRIDAVPEPDGHDHTQYGELLRPRPFNLITDSPEQLHVWYLFEGTRIIHAILSRGLYYWGQLHTYHSNSGRMDEFHSRDLDLAADKIAVLNRFLELYRKGRPYPVDRSVLEGSGIISPKFIDRVTELAMEVSNDPQRLLDALSNKAVAGFLTRNIDALEEYFLEEGYISEEPLLEISDIQIQLAAMISNTKLGPEEAQRFLTAVITPPERD